MTYAIESMILLRRNLLKTWRVPMLLFFALFQLTISTPYS